MGGVLASASVDGSIILWDLQTGAQQEHLYQEGNESIRSCSFSPNGQVIASGDDSGCVCIWSQSKTLMQTMRFHEEAVTAVAFSHDSNIFLSACTQGNVRIFDVKDGFEGQLNPVCSLDNCHDLGVLGAEFCNVIHVDPADQQTRCYTLATCGTDQYFKIWRIYYTGHVGEDTVKSRLIPTSVQEHVCGTTAIYPTETMNAECVLTCQGHGSSITSVKFNSTGTLLVTSGLDKAVKIWDLQGNCLKTMGEHSRYVNCIAINADCSVVASGSNDRSVIIWDLTGGLTLDSHIVGMRSILFKFATNQGEVPMDFICPITHEIMKDPVLTADGFSYERNAIEDWFKMKATSPMTNLQVDTTEIMEHKSLKQKIDKYLQSLDPFE